MKLTNTLINEVLETFRLRKVKDEQREIIETKGELYDLGDECIKSIKDYEVLCPRQIDGRGERDVAR